MKNLSIYLCALLWFTALSAQNHPANGISYQAMLSQSQKITYGTKLQNIPVANKDIKARFELSQSGAIVFTDEHRLTTDVNGIFSCIIGTGNTTPFGTLLTDINWGLDSVMVRVFIDAGEGENLFSEQKLWSTAYAMYAPTSGRALNDKDTSATNELQYLNLVGDSVKLTSVSGGISLKPWSDGIAKNAQDIAAEKLRAETSEFNIQGQINTLKTDLTKNQNNLEDIKDSIFVHRIDINGLSKGVSQNSQEITKNTNSISANANSIANNTISIDRNKLDIGSNATNIANTTLSINTNKTNIKSNTDSIAVHRSELNKNRSDINSNKTAIATNKLDIATNKSDIGTNATNININKTNIANNKADIKSNIDSIAVHRSELNKNRGDINSNKTAIANNKSDIATNKSDIGTIKTEINTNKTNITANKNAIDNHIAADKDTDNTNELSDLSFNSSTNELKLDNSKTAGNKVDLSSLKDNLGNHTAQDTLDLNGNVLTDNTGDTLLIAIKGNDRDITIESEDEVFIRTINNPNNVTNGDIQLESSDDIILGAKADINLISGDDVTIEANGDDITLKSADDIHVNSGEDIFLNATDKLEMLSGNGSNIKLNSDNDIELITTNNDFVEVWKKNSSGTPEFMYTLPNNRGTIGQFLQRSSDGSGEYFSGWSTYKLPTTDGFSGQSLTTDGSGNVKWSTGGSDNLGNHKATQNIELAGKYLSNDGGNEGIAIDNQGRVGIGTNTPSTGAILDVSSTTGAFLPPRMTESQRNAINNIQVGSVIFNQTRNKLQVFIDSVNGDYKQLSSQLVYDGPYHAQTFRPSTKGKLSKLRCVSGQRFTFITYLNCDVYEGDPSGTLTSLGTADNTIKMTNPTGMMYPPKVIADFTFNNLNKVLEVGKTYTFVFVAKDSTTGEPRQCWFPIGTNSTNSMGEYWRGSTISGLTSPNSKYDMEGSIELIYDSPKWVDLH